MKSAIAIIVFALLFVGSAEAGSSGRITVGIDCTSEKVSTFSPGTPIYLRGDGFTPYENKIWIVELLDRTSQGGTKTHYYVAHGQVTMDTAGTFCAYTLTPSAGYAGYRYLAWLDGKKTQFTIE